MVEAARVACWKADSASAILRTEALEGDEAIFLATHSSVRGFRVAGSQASEVQERSEEGLLDTLSDPRRRHAFCVVQGEPGSGKSHLIRWLSMNWACKNDVVLLLQRADGSLDGALSQLQKKLPPEFKNLFEGLGQRHKASLEGRASDFLTSLGNRLAPKFYENNKFDDAEWCGKHDVQSLILSTTIRRHWTAPRRILEVLDGKAGNRNSETASFDIHDIIELAKFANEINDSVPANLLARQLRKEALAVEDAGHQDVSPEDLVTQNPRSVQTSLKLARALNLRRNDAVQNVIGVSAARLKELFEGVRTELGRNNRRLVLLLEDITSWEGLDDSLVDALVINADTRDDDVCPLISVVGVTPRYYDQLQGNYRQRITHEVHLGEASGALQDVATMREARDRSAFISRYLSAARAGVKSLRLWREEFRKRRDLKPPNICIECPQRDACHRVFGEVDGVGLFPFTEDAVTDFFHALKADDKGQTHRTPRGLVQHVLSPTLLNPKALGQGNYPGPDIESWGLEREQLALSGDLRSLLQAQVEDPKTKEQLQRVFALWGDRSRPEVTADPTSGRRLANVPEGVFTAFGLPWIGGSGEANPLRPRPQGEPHSDTVVDGTNRDSDDKGEEPTQTSTALSTKSSGGTLGRPPRASHRDRGQTGSELSRLREQVAMARDGTVIREAGIWHSVISQIMGSLEWRKLGIDRWTWSRLFTPDLVKIAGTGRTGAAHFVLEREATLYDGLEAYAELKIGDLSDELADFHRRKLALFMRRLESLARAHAESRLAGTNPGETWNAAGAITQILLARAWLRQSTSPAAQLYVQWHDLLSDEREAGAEPNSRTETWREFLNATHAWHDRFRQILREMVSLPQGTAGSFGLADAGMVAAILIAFKDTPLAFAHMIAGPVAGVGINELDAVTDLTSEFSTKLSEIPRRELELLKSRASDLDAALNGVSIRSRADRLDAVVRNFSEQLPGQALQPQKAWQEARAASARLLLDSKATELLQNWIIDLVGAGESIPQTPPALLDWLARAPANDLKSARELFVLHGAKLITELLPIIRDRVRAGQQTVDLSSIHNTGSTLRAAASKASAALQRGSR